MDAVNKHVQITLLVLAPMQLASDILVDVFVLKVTFVKQLIVMHHVSRMLNAQ